MRLLLLLLIAEAPLVVFTTVLAFQNEDLRSSDALAQASMAQHAALADALISIRVANGLAKAARKLPPGLLSGSSDCAAVLRTLIAPNSDRVAEAIIMGPDGTSRCSATDGLPAQDVKSAAWAGTQADMPDKPRLSIMGDMLVIGRRLIVGGRVVALITIRLREQTRAVASPEPAPTLWLHQDNNFLPIGAGDTASLPRDTTHLDVAPNALRLNAQDGRAFLYASAPLPPEFGPHAGTLVAASDIRHAASTTRGGILLLIAQMTGFFLAELFLIVAGVSFVVSLPLRRFNANVRRWRDGSALDAAVQPSDPLEVRELKVMFQQAAESLDEREGELQGSITQQDLLMQEIHHRVKNNLQIIASLLNLQASRIKLPEAQAEFQSARDRVRALATLHRHLYADGELHMIDMKAFFAELCSQLFQGLDEIEGERITIQVEAPEIEISSDQAVPIALIVTETVGNAIKYAFPDGRPGLIRLTFTVTPDKHATLVISDNGVGVGDLAEGDTGPEGLGLQLARGFARQLGSTLVVSRTEGTCYRVDLILQRHRKFQPKPGGSPNPALQS